MAEAPAGAAPVHPTGEGRKWDGDLTRVPFWFSPAESHARGHAAGIVYAGSRAMLRDRVTALRRANIFERQSYRHIVGLPVPGTDGQSAETPFLVARIMRDGRTDLFATGDYLDRLDDAGGLRFAERIVVCDSHVFDTLLAIPL